MQKFTFWAFFLFLAVPVFSQFAVETDNGIIITDNHAHVKNINNPLPEAVQVDTTLFYSNFVYNANGSLCTLIAPDAAFTAYINDDLGKILIENAARSDGGSDPNIGGNGMFGVDLINFINPEALPGDVISIRFSDTYNGQRATVSDTIQAPPWLRFPEIVTLQASTFPDRPENVTLAYDSSTGHRTVSWDAVAGMTYTVYRRNLNDVLPDGQERKLYSRLAEGLTSGQYTDNTALMNDRYGYIVYAVDNDVYSAHSLEVNEAVSIEEDLNVGWIARLPRIDYIWGSTQPDFEGWPTVGQQVTWQAVVKNWSASINEDVKYHWYFDGVLVDSGTVDMPPDSFVTIDYDWNWTFDRHTVGLVLDPWDEVFEYEEGNNEVTVYTNAIAAGFYVEQSLYDYFHEHQHKLKANSNSWEDWAQRHVSRWNAMFANAIYPQCPDGVLDRIRLDAIHVVPDGALPLAGGLPSNHPNKNDRTIDLQWGFTAEMLNGTFYSNHTSRSDNNPFYFEGSLMHELGHARYLIDLYGFNIHDDGTGNTIDILENGELIVPRYLPLNYYTPKTGLMNGQYTFVDPYSPACMNLIAGHRAVMGNYNSPGNIGVFMDDLADNNFLIIKDTDGNILVGASVEVYQAEGQTGSWYGKYFDDTPDIFELTTDSEGKVNAGSNPFANDGHISHTYGISEGCAIVRVEHNSLVGYKVIESTDFNIAYWMGDTVNAYFELEFDLQDPLGVDDNEDMMPEKLTLQQNYPNPFNPVTSISYYLPERTSVTLTIYSMLGDEVITLVQSEQATGEYTVSWNGMSASGFPAASGMYIYTLKTDTKIISKKMILMK